MRDGAAPRRHRARRAACDAAAALALCAALLPHTPAAAADAAASAPASPVPKTVAKAAALPPQRSLRVFGATLRYHELGRGPTVVLVHGLGSSAAGDWGRIMRPLAATHHVIAPDLLGFGASDKPVLDYGIQTWVDVLGEFLRLKGVAGATDGPTPSGGFTLVGESMGGWIAAQYALQALAGTAADPAFALPKPSHLVLADAAGHRASWQALIDPPPDAGEPIGASLAGQQQLMRRIFADPSYQSADGVRAAFAWSLAKGDSATIHAVMHNRATLGETIDGKLAGITVPTLVVWGEHDQLIPLDEGRAYARGISNARWVVIPGAGHAPMIETPELFLEALRGFLP